MLFVLRIENCVLRKKEKEKIQKQNNIEKTRAITILFFILLPHQCRVIDFLINNNLCFYILFYFIRYETSKLSIIKLAI